MEGSAPKPYALHLNPRLSNHGAHAELSTEAHRDLFSKRIDLPDTELGSAVLRVPKSFELGIHMSEHAEASSQGLCFEERCLLSAPQLFVSNPTLSDVPLRSGSTPPNP